MFSVAEAKHKQKHLIKQIFKYDFKNIHAKFALLLNISSTGKMRFVEKIKNIYKKEDIFRKYVVALCCGVLMREDAFWCVTLDVEHW